MDRLQRRNQITYLASLRLRVRFAFAAAIVWFFASTTSHGSLVTDAFIEAVAQVESGGDANAKGDGGKALGRWQMHEAAWADTSDYRAGKGQQVWPFEQATEASVARLYARDYLIMLENRLRKELGDCVTTDMIYAAYNMGFGNLRKQGFALDNAPSSTRTACARVSELASTLEKSAAVLAKAD